MLKGIPALISPDLLCILAQMGHGDELVISDAHFPAYSVNPRVIRLDAVSSPKVMEAILQLIELDQYVEKPVAMMAPVPGDSLNPELQEECRKILGKNAGRIDYVERFAFYERARKAFAVVVSGESRTYGNIILKKGVTF